MADGSPYPDNPKTARLAAGDLVDRPPQRAGRRPPPAVRQAVDHRARRRAAATRSTCRRPARTTAGRSSPTAATTRCLKIGEGTAKPGLEQPIYYWDPSIAPSGAAFYTGDRLPGVEGQPVRRRACRPGPAPPGARRRAGLSARRSCSPIWASASATCATAPTASSGCSPTAPRVACCGWCRRIERCHPGLYARDPERNGLPCAVDADDRSSAPAERWVPGTSPGMTSVCLTATAAAVRWAGSGSAIWAPRARCAAAAARPRRSRSRRSCRAAQRPDWACRSSPSASGGRRRWHRNS